MQNIIRRYRYSAILLTQLVKTDFKLRYQGSVLGYLWSLLKPLLLFVILYIVFAQFLRLGDEVPHFPIYLLLGIVLWNYFAEVTVGSVAAIVGRGDLLRKINFPKYVIVLAGSFSALINLFLNLIVVGIFMAFADVELSWDALLILPIILELFVFAIGAAFFLSALYVKFRDVSYIWEVLMQAAFYLTPIIYPLSRITDFTIHGFTLHSATVLKIIMLNPMAQIIQDSRYVLVTPQSPVVGQFYGGNWLAWLIPIGIVVVVSITAALYFRKRSRFFAEEV